MVINKHNARKYLWADRCSSWVFLESQGISIKQELMPPGTRELLHKHQRAEQFFYILKGTATFYLQGEKILLESEQGITVSPENAHYISNESLLELEFLVISRPSTDSDRINLTAGNL